MQHFLTWDTGILAAFGILLAYSLIIRKHKALATLVSVYVAYVGVVLFGNKVVDFFNGQTVINQVWITSQASPLVIKSILMIVIAFMLSSSMKLGGKRSRYQSWEVVVYAVATLALTVAFILSFMDPAQQNTAVSSSQILPYVLKWKDWVVGVPIGLMIIFGLYLNEE